MRSPSWRQLWTALVSVLWLGTSVLAVAASARADHEHVVASGQSLGGIAKRYGVAVSQLAAANHMSFGSKLKLGQVLVIPAAGTVFVGRGDTLAKIAHAHQVDTEDLAKCNHLSARTSLKAGQRLHLPGFDDEGEASDGEKKWGAPKHPGLLTLYRVWSKETRRLRILDTRGRVRDDAVRQLRGLLRPRLHANRRKDPHPRLLRLISQVSDHFGGRPIHIISGFRLPGGNTRDTSRHVAGEAMDFRIPGVPLTELRDYCQHFDHAGVGYYPRTQFVHLDVRRTSTRWTDWSLAGEPAMAHPPGPSGQNHGASAGSGDADATEEADEPTSEDEGQPPIDDDGT